MFAVICRVDVISLVKITFERREIKTLVLFIFYINKKYKEK